MKYLKFLCLIFLLSSCGLASARRGHRPGRSKDGAARGKKMPKNSVQAIGSCMGQRVDLKDKLDIPLVDECLAMKVTEFQETFETNQETKQDDNVKKGKKERKEKKKENRKEKLTNKLRKKCATECEWRSLNLVPDINGTDSYPPQNIPDSFLMAFPEQAKEKVKAGMESCYNMTTPSPPNGRKGPLKQMCFTNVRLLRCFGRVIRKACNGRGESTSTVMPGTENVTGSIPPTDGSTETTRVSDDDDDDDVDDDKDDDDENEVEDVTTTATTTSTAKKEKDASPTTSVNTAKPVTK